MWCIAVVPAALILLLACFVIPSSSALPDLPLAVSPALSSARASAIPSSPRNGSCRTPGGSTPLDASSTSSTQRIAGEDQTAGELRPALQTVGLLHGMHCGGDNKGLRVQVSLTMIGLHLHRSLPKTYSNVAGSYVLPF